jgi:hypothetical protein
MAAITTRAAKGSPLTNSEVDANFDNLNTDKMEVANFTATNIALTLGTTPVAFADNVNALASLKFNTASGTPAYTAGQLFWDEPNKTLTLQTGTTNLQIGQEQYLLVTNSSGASIGEGKVVYISGATLGKPTISLAIASSSSTADAVIGVTTQVIADGSSGFVTVAGVVNTLDTSAYVAGQTIYLSPSVAGSFTSTTPTSPDYVVHLGHVLTVDAVNGSILVSVDTITQTANSVRIDSGAGVVELNNVQDFFKHAWSSGVTNGCALTDNGDGTVSIASGEICIRASASENALLTPLVVPAQANITCTANDVSYLYVNYNAGSPVWQVAATLSDFNGMDKVIGYVVGRNGLALNVVDLRNINVDFGRKNRRQKVESDGFIFNGWYRSSLAKSPISSSGLNVQVGAGRYYFFDNPHEHSSFDTSVAGTATANVFKNFYNRTGSWTQQVDQKTINATQYDLAGTLTTLGNGRYRTDYVYAVMGLTNDYLAVVMGNAEYANLAAAQAAPAPTTLPPQIDGIAILVGQVCIVKSASTLTVTSVTALSVGAGAAATVHNNLTSIQGGTAGEYYHLSSAELTSLLAHYVSTANPHSVTKTQVGLGNVDNTSNATERAASATLTNKSFGNALTITDNSANPALKVTQTGTGHAFVVEDVASDTTPFVIDANGMTSLGFLNVFRQQTGSVIFDATPTSGAYDGLIWNASDSTGYYSWQANGVERMRIGADGTVVVGGAITAGASSTFIGHTAHLSSRTDRSWSNSQSECRAQSGAPHDFASTTYHCQDQSSAYQWGYDGNNQKFGLFDSSGGWTGGWNLSTGAFEYGAFAINTAYIPSTTAQFQLSTDVLFTSINGAIMGNMYYSSGWKYAGNGSGCDIKFASTSDIAFAVEVAANNTGGAGAAASVFSALLIKTDGAVLANSPTGGLGYGIGAGGAVTQVTSKATGVTLNKPCGRIITTADSIAAGGYVEFWLYSSIIADTDTVIVNHRGGSSNYSVKADQVSPGGVVIYLKNISGGALADAVQINFTVIKGSTT